MTIKAYSQVVLIIFILLILVICFLSFYIIKEWKFRKQQKNYFEYLDALFIMLAHDIKSPIIALKEATSIIKESLKNNDVKKAINFIEKFDNTIQKLDRTTQNVLNFGNGYHFDEQPCDVKTMMENVINYFSYAKVGSEKIDVEYIIEDENLIIKCPEGLGIIIRNWIMNTIKHSNAHTIRVSISRTGKNTNFVIQDDGDIMESSVAKCIMTAISHESQNEYTQQKKFGLFLISIFLRFTKSTASFAIKNGKNSFIIKTN